MPAESPRVSVILPAYGPEPTLAECLSRLGRQTLPPADVILVDGNPSDCVERLLRDRFPSVLHERTPVDWLPHARRNRGAAAARGDLLLFTDPDAYASPDWIERLAAALGVRGAAAAGAVVCHGRRPFDVAVHLCKFDSWLPGGAPREIAVGPTVGLLVRRAVFDRMGGFRGELWLGDAEFSWRLARSGEPVRFVPGAVVAHHHLTSGARFLRERFVRGREFARLRAAEGCWTRLRAAAWIAATLLPARFLKLLLRVARNAVRAGMARDILRSLPVVSAGEAAWLAGEVAGFLPVVRVGSGGS